MEVAAVSYLNQHTREVLDLVKLGRTVEITDRGRPIARIVPIRPALTGVAARLVAEGRAQAPRRDRPLSWPDEPVDPTSAGSRALAELREDEPYGCSISAPTSPRSSPTTCAWPGQWTRRSRSQARARRSVDRPGVAGGE